MSAGRRTIDLEDLGDHLEGATLTPTSVSGAHRREGNPPPDLCSHPLGCEQPALEGRRYCHHHAAQVQHRAAELMKAKKKKRK